jgi:hypothetical protein
LTELLFRKETLVSILPGAFMVRYRLPVPRFDRLPRGGSKLLDLPPAARLAWPARLDEASEHVDLRAGWNPQGLGFALTVTGRTMPVLSDVEQPTKADSLELWIDTRDMQTVHRATRYCHHFAVLPIGGGDKGRDAVTVPLPVARARDDAPLARSEVFLTQCHLQKGGYLLEVWIPAEALTGFDVAHQPRLGFYCQVNDAEHGALAFATGPEFPASSDPSLWHTLELSDA